MELYSPFSERKYPLVLSETTRSETIDNSQCQSSFFNFFRTLVALTSCPATKPNPCISFSLSIPTSFPASPRAPVTPLRSTTPPSTDTASLHSSPVRSSQPGHSSQSTFVNLPCEFLLPLSPLYTGLYSEKRV